MTKKELLDKIQNFPNDSPVHIFLPGENEKGTGGWVAADRIDIFGNMDAIEIFINW